MTPEELERYDRQLGDGVLSVEGQLRLKRASALVTRAGGMGGPAAMAMVMAGVGCVTIAHGGEMISADLNRQVLGAEAVLGKPRASHFAEYLRSLNRFVQVEAIDHEPDDDEAVDLARRMNVIVSCPPTFAERMRLNRAATTAGIPLIDAAQWGMMGTLIVLEPGRTACLECVYPEEPEFEELFPVVGAISSAMGSLAALEAIKIISGCGTPILGRMMMIDGYRGQTSIVELARNDKCPCCGSPDKSAPPR